MNVTLSIDEQLVARARKKAEAMGKSLNQAIRDYLQRLAGGDDPERPGNNLTPIDYPLNASRDPNCLVLSYLSLSEIKSEHTD